MTKPHTTLSEAVRALELPEHSARVESQNETGSMATVWMNMTHGLLRDTKIYTEDQVCAVLSAAAELVEQHEAQEPVELVGVQEQMKEGAGFWHSCSGCHETEDGHPVGSYPYSDVFKCALGNGCSECGGIGAVWDNTDYDAIAVGLESDSAQPTLAATQAGDAWISVQDRLPEFDFTANRVSMVVRVIAALRDGTVCQMGYWANGWTQEDSKPGWSFADGRRCLGHHITHWQPLPSAPTTTRSE